MQLRRRGRCYACQSSLLQAREGRKRDREREREIEKDKETVRQRKRDRETARQRQTERQTDEQREREREREREKDHSEDNSAVADLNNVNIAGVNLIMVANLLHKSTYFIINHNFFVVQLQHH